MWHWVMLAGVLLHPLSLSGLWEINKAGVGVKQAVWEVWERRKDSRLQQRGNFLQCSVADPE